MRVFPIVQPGQNFGYLNRDKTVSLHLSSLAGSNHVALTLLRRPLQITSIRLNDQRTGGSDI
jgi:hypothetical protein